MVCASLVWAPIAQAEPTTTPQPIGVVALEHMGQPGFWVSSRLFRVMVRAYDRAKLLEERLQVSEEEIVQLRKAADDYTQALNTANARVSTLKSALNHAAGPWERLIWGGSGLLVGICSTILVAWALARNSR